MTRRGPLNQVLAQLTADQQQAAADAERQRIAAHNATGYNTRHLLLAMQFAHEMEAIARRFSPNA